MTTAEDVTVEAWLAWRREGVGASDVAGILGISPWSSPWKVWADKSGLLPDPEPGQVAEQLEAGHWMELAIGPWFASRTGLHVAGEQLMLSHPDWPVARCTLDGLVFDSIDVADLSEMEPRTVAGMALGGLEMKHEAFGRPWELVPAHYQAQGLWQMYVAGLERVWFAVLQGRSLRIHELVRDQAEIDWMVDTVRQWWSNHVLSGVPPEVDGSDATAAALAAVFPTQEPDTVVELDAAAAEVVARWKQAKDARRSAEEVEQAAANAVRALIGDREAAVVDGQKVASWKAQSSARVDADWLRATHPEIARAATRTSSTRVLRPHTPKEKA